MAAALLLTVFNWWDDRRAGESASGILEQIREETVQSGEDNGGEIPDYLLNPDMEMPVKLIDGNEYIGTLDIPALGLSLPVMSEWSYPKLRIAPCRYAGSAYDHTLVIAAHNYRSHFGNLKHLRGGEEVKFTDVDGNVFCYSVEEIQILHPEDVDEMSDETWDLTLFTCTIGGSTRITVRCTEVPVFQDAKSVPSS